MSRPGPAMIAIVHRRRLATLTGLVALVPAVLAGGCGRSTPKALTPTTTATAATTTTTATITTTTTTTTATITTTTTTTTTTAATSTTAAPRRSVAASSSTTSPAAWRPPSPEPTASQAAYELVGAWADNDRKAALADASPAAVAALFANPYPPGGPQYRGCSTPPGNAQSSCVFRSGNDLLSLTTVAFPDGWGVTAAIMES
jgi:hypothetical protein